MSANRQHLGYLVERPLNMLVDSVPQGAVAPTGRAANVRQQRQARSNAKLIECRALCDPGCVDSGAARDQLIELERG
jgi:hypothetical protein